MTYRIDPSSLLGRIPVHTTTALNIPHEFERLFDVAHNLWWTWDQGATRLWSRIDPRAWFQNRNPISMMQAVGTETWEALIANGDFVDLYHDVIRRFDAYIAGKDTWYKQNHAGALEGGVAYLCAEFGIHHTLRFYSGGLGVLAGDHAKAASDLGIPFVGVGLLYRFGYFHQTVDPDGNQQHHYNRLEMARRPFREVLDLQGNRLRVTVELPGREVHMSAWRIDVGRVPILMLDTFLAENDPADRPITNMLYVRGRDMRLSQEILLGIGAVRLIDKLGIEPSMWHVNEGHAAFSLLERLSERVSDGFDFDDAHKDVEQNTLFTLHTPVPAGNEVFDLGTVQHYIDDTLPGVPESTLAEFGRSRDDGGGRFDLGALAIRLSSITNGVSKRHGDVVTRDWSHLIGGPAHSVTNGVHPQTWVGRGMARLYQRALGVNWPDKLTTPEVWESFKFLPNVDVWEAHEEQKELMMLRLRNRLQAQLARHGAGPDELRQVDDQLPANRLTLVFGRRFAMYKRAGLLFSDPGRIRALLTNPERPVQVIFTGKAHPADREGQGLIRWVWQLARSPELRGHVYFVEDYDLQVARWLVAGADVWLNNPKPPLEASGTSGMKAAMNGVLNLSVLDGWWREVCEHDVNGWGFNENSNSDVEDAGTLYHLLETAVVPRFYDRNDEDVPTVWVEMMKRSIADITPAFSTHRMVRDYTEMAYVPLARSEP